MVKKFIDKKKSATFQLRPRDSGIPNSSSESGRDSVFVRVDTNDFSVDAFADRENGDSSGDGGIKSESSIFSDAIDDTDGEDEGEVFNCRDTKLSFGVCSDPRAIGLPEEVRREILELGLPDDGYNYMVHLREIKKTGCGSVFYPNSKAKMSGIPFDFKAFDAAGLNIVETGACHSGETPICQLADRTTGVRLGKTVDPDVAALLHSAHSDAEELDEDFIFLANHNAFPEPRPFKVGPGPPPQAPAGPRTLLDERLDQLLLEEYASDREEFALATGDAFTTEKLGGVFRGRPEAEGAAETAAEYRAPADVLQEGERRRDGAEVEYAAAVKRMCAEYAERYRGGGEEEEMVAAEEEEEEEWDCESVVSTYSNLDNHPGKIDAPAGRRRREEVPESRRIALSGKHMLPAGFLLPGRRRERAEKVKLVDEQMADMLKRRQEGETREEKKERKAAVKTERREARRAKKETKGLFVCDAQATRKVLASLAPPSIRIV